MGRDVVVVLSYRGKNDTERCVASIVTGSPEASILVVDNGSDDGVLESVSARWPRVATHQTGENLGFSGGMNAGLRLALAQGAATVTVLNNDTIVAPGAVRALARVAASGSAVSPEVRYADGTERVWFAGGAIDPATNLARHLSDAELALTPADAAGLRPSKTLAGCCVTASRETWQRVGLFDERYFLNFEDSDWSVRAAQAGVPLVVDTRTVIHHRVSASFNGAYTYLGLFYYARNGLLFGRNRCGGSVLQSTRFLRQHVVPAVISPLRQRELAEGLRRGLVLGLAMGAVLLRRYGRAPRSLERLAQRWSAS